MALKGTLEERIARVARETIAIMPYDPQWPGRFESEARRLRSSLPPSLVNRIEHFGSTAVPGLAAKPVVDMLVEVSSLEMTRQLAAPLLEAEGYDYFWRPEPPDGPAMYAWFIKRDAVGHRTHHVHMVEAASRMWDALFFRDYLRQFPEEAARYAALKTSLSQQFRNDREGYTRGKTDFVIAVTQRAKRYYGAAE